MNVMKNSKLYNLFISYMNSKHGKVNKPICCLSESGLILYSNSRFNREFNYNRGSTYHYFTDLLKYSSYWNEIKKTNGTIGVKLKNRTYRSNYYLMNISRNNRNIGQVDYILELTRVKKRELDVQDTKYI